MKNYHCEYEEGHVIQSIDDWKLPVEADDPRQAYEKFIKELGVFNHRVYVRRGFKGQYFDDHVISEKKELEIQKKAQEKQRKQDANDACGFLNQKKQDGFFLLETVDKVNSQLLFEEIISNSEKGPLFPEEVQYIEKWLSFKHRELGQSLLAQAEAQKPKDQQGTSQLGKLALAGVALSTMKLSQDIGAVSDQVENINEGLGFEG